MSSFYAVAVGVKPGIYTNWNECKIQIENYQNAVFKKFDNFEEANNFIKENNNNLYVYTDGACSSNGSTNARAGIGIYFSKDNPLNVSRELDGSKIKLTNNIAELVAIIEAITIIKNNPIPNKIIVTDSEYAIKCATTFGSKLEKHEWKLKDQKIKNLELVKTIYELTNKYDIKYKHIMAHTANKDKHSIGNYYADQLANKSIGNFNSNSSSNSNSNSNSKIYLNVSFQEKDNAKAKGARWDAEKKKWYIFNNSQHKDELLKKYS